MMKLKNEIRNRIIENEKRELQSLLDMYKLHTSAADLDEDSSLSNEDFAQQDQSRESARALKNRINQAKIALDNFINLNHEAKTIVEPGAMVLTNTLNFYIGISASKFEYDGRTFIGLEPSAPIYTVFEGAKKGDKVTFNEHEYHILEVE